MGCTPRWPSCWLASCPQGTWPVLLVKFPQPLRWGALQLPGAGRVCKGQGDKRTLSECPGHAPSYRSGLVHSGGGAGRGQEASQWLGSGAQGFTCPLPHGVSPQTEPSTYWHLSNPFCSVLGTAEGPRGRGASPWWVQEAREGGWRLLGTARLSSQVSAAFWKLPQGSPPKSRLRGRSWSVPGPGPRGFR